MNRRNARPDFDAPDAVMRAAGAWLARHDRGLIDEETTAFHAWLEASPQHRAAFAQLERTSAAFNELRRLAPSNSVEPDPDAFAPQRRIIRWKVRAFAAAGLAAAAALALVFWTGELPPSTEQHLTTEASSYHRSVLSDGSVIELNGTTEVQVQFSSTQRRARLSRGEAHFRVAPNPAKPFVVTADSVEVRVVGTEFNVRMAASEIEILVTKGIVDVVRHDGPASLKAAAAELRLQAGEKIVVPTATEKPVPPAARVSADEMERLLAWQAGMAEFRRTPLGEIVAEMNRRSAGRFPAIVIRDAELSALSIGGNFRLDQPEAFVLLLERNFGIIVERSPDAIVLKPAP